MLTGELSAVPRPDQENDPPGLGCTTLVRDPSQTQLDLEFGRRPRISTQLEWIARSADSSWYPLRTSARTAGTSSGGRKSLVSYDEQTALADGRDFQVWKLARLRKTACSCSRTPRTTR